jgi:hypothetical protein
LLVEYACPKAVRSWTSSAWSQSIITLEPPYLTYSNTDKNFALVKDADRKIISMYRFWNGMACFFRSYYR